MTTLHPDQHVWGLDRYLGPLNQWGYSIAVLKAWNRGLFTIRDLAKHTRKEWLKHKGIGRRTVDDWETLANMAGLTMGKPGKSDRDGYLRELRDRSNRNIDDMHRNEETRYMFSRVSCGWLRVSPKRTRFLGGSFRDDPKTLDPLHTVSPS